MFTAIFIHILEWLAFFTGIFYYKKSKSRPAFYLVCFLGITVFVETLGLYTIFVYNGFLEGLQGTLLEKNFWLYNIYSIVSYLFYISFFKWFLVSPRAVRVMNLLTAIFVIVSLADNLFSGGYFYGFMPITHIVGTLFVFMSIAFYYLQLLQGNQILEIRKSIPFYVSVGALIFHLCSTPLFIYSSYFKNSIDPGFVSLYIPIIFIVNLILYSIYIIGFLICSHKQNPYYGKKNY